MAEFRSTHIIGQVVIDDDPTQPNHVVLNKDSRLLQVGATVAALSLETTQRLTRDEALTQLILILQSAFDGNVSAVQLVLTSLTNRDESLSQLIANLDAAFQSNLGSQALNTAALALQLTALVNRDEALTQLIATLRTDFDGNNTEVGLTLTSLTNSTQSLAQLIAALRSDFNDNTASVGLTLTTLATQYSAVATLVAAIQVSVAGNTVAITQEAQVRADALGNLYARYAVQIDLNGRVSGYELLDGTGGQSSFIIKADIFGVINPDYPLNTFPSTVSIGNISGLRFQTNVGTGAANVFHNVSGVNIPIHADVFIFATLKGVGIGTGFDSARLRRSGVNTFIVHFAGQCRFGTVWWRIPTQGSTWYPFLAMGVLHPDLAAGAYPFAGPATQDISVGALETIQFAVNGLTGFASGDTDDDTNNDIYGGIFLVQVVNF